MTDFFLHQTGEIELFLKDSTEIDGRIFAEGNRNSVRYLNSGLIQIETSHRLSSGNSFYDSLLAKNAKAFAAYREDFKNRMP